MTPDLERRLEVAMRMTAPGTALRRALDMIIAGRLGALICVGDVDAVLASGNDGFPLNISFTANRLFELSKMDGAVVLDGDLTQIYRANFHLNPDPNIATSETGMRHRTAARMSIKTDAMVISVSERRHVVNVYVHGRSFQLQTVQTLMGLVNQLITTMQSCRQIIDRNLVRLSTLELDDYVTVADLVSVISNFELLFTSVEELDILIDQLGSEGRISRMQREQIMNEMDETYSLLIRDYSLDSSEENAAAIRERLHDADNAKLNSSSWLANVLGYEGMREDSVISPLGLRTLSRISVVREGMADKIVDTYGSLKNLLDAIEDDAAVLNDLGVQNPAILADSLFRLWGRKE